MKIFVLHEFTVRQVNSLFGVDSRYGFPRLFQFLPPSSFLHPSDSRPSERERVNKYVPSQSKAKARKQESKKARKKIKKENGKILFRVNEENLILWYLVPWQEGALV